MDARVLNLVGWSGLVLTVMSVTPSGITATSSTLLVVGVFLMSEAYVIGLKTGMYK